MIKKVIIIFILLTSFAYAEGQCSYHSTTIVENGITISTKETKVCDETQQIGKQSFLTKEEKMQMFETGLILTFLFILEHM